MRHLIRRHLPPQGMQLILAFLCGLTIASAWFTASLTVLPLVVPSAAYHPIALLTNGLVAAPVGPFGLILFLGLVAFFNQDALRFLWRRSPQTVLLWTLGPLAALFVADRWLIPGHAFGLATDALLLAWFGGTVERQWGMRRTLWFAAIVSVASNAVVTVLLWLAPGTLSALGAPAAAPPIGAGPLSFGLLTVWCLMQGDRPLMIINAPARKLVIAIAIFKGIGLIFIGVASALYDLTGIGVAALLVSGRWHPARWRRRPRPRLVRDDERRYHRGGATPGALLCSRDLACGTVATGAAEGSMMHPGQGS